MRLPRAVPLAEIKPRSGVAQSAGAAMQTPGRGKIGVSKLMPLDRFRMALESLGCTIEAEEPAPPDAMLFGPTFTISGPFETQKDLRWLASDAKILAYRLPLTVAEDEVPLAA